MTTLRQRMIEDMQVRNLSPRTQAAYVLQVALFARHFHQTPQALGPEEVRAYELYLTNERKLAPSSTLLAVAALRFLYKVTLQKDWKWHQTIPAPKRPQTLPVVLSPEEVRHFLACVSGFKHRTLLTSCYAAGLRLSEAMGLKVTDIDSRRMVLRVDQGKGQKDRYVMLSPKLLDLLRVWWRVARPQGWLFPGHRAGDPISKTAVEDACRQAHRRCGLAKPITPHSLRHPPAGSRHRPAHHPTLTGPPQPATCVSPPPRCARPKAPSTCCRSPCSSAGPWIGRSSKWRRSFAATAKPTVKRTAPRSPQRSAAS